MDDTPLLEPYMYLSDHPGKEIRTKLIVAFDAWLHVGESMHTVCQAVEMLHTASLLVDDVEDGSEMRRGVPGTSPPPAAHRRRQPRTASLACPSRSTRPTLCTSSRSRS